MQLNFDPDNLSVQLRFAISCLKEDAVQAEQLLPDVDWKAFFTLIHRHRMGPIVSRKIRKLRLPVPDEVAVHLKSVYYQNVVRSLAHTQCIQQIASGLDDSGIDFMIVKGFSNQAGYDNLPDRHVNDLDILVRRESQVWLAVKVLKNNGLDIETPDGDPDQWSNRQKQDYLKRRKHLELIGVRNPVRVELHFRLFAYSGKWDLDAEALWSGTKALDIAGRNITALSDDKHLQYLMLHGSACAWFRLKWLIDVYFILREQTDDDLIRLLHSAKENDWLRPFLLTMSVLKFLFEIRLPEELTQSITADRVLYSMQNQVIRSLHELPPADRIHQPVLVRGNALLRRALYEIRLQPGLMSIWQFFLKWGFNPANWQAVPLPASLHFLYVWLNPFIHLGRVLKSRLTR